MSETLTGQAALDALAREICDDCNGSGQQRIEDDSFDTPENSRCETCNGQRLRYPLVSRPCPEGYRVKGGPCPDCAGSGVLPLPLDTAAVGPLLDTLHDNGWSAESNPGQLTVYRDDSPDYRIFTEPELYDRLLAALAWADAQRKES